MALTMDDVDRIVVEAEPELLQRLDLNVALKAKLVKEGVITDDLLDVLNVPLYSKKELVHIFLADFKYGPVEKFLNFCRVVHEDGRPQILTALGVDITDVWTQLGSTPSPTPEGCRPLDRKGNPFPHQRRYYQEVLSKVPMYEYVMRSSFCQIEEIFTKLELIDNDNDQDLRKFPFRAQSKSIQLDEMFDEINNSPLRIILEGKPGTGKSSILKHCAIEWAKRNLLSRGDQAAGCSSQGVESRPFPLVKKDLVIYIDKSHEKSDLDSTIKAALKGPKDERDKAFQFWQKQPQNSLLMVDGIDEFINEELVNEIFHLASEAGANIMISCRTAHQRLENQTKHFNRHVKVCGFNPESANMFVQRFMKTLNAGVSNDDEKKTTEEKTKTLCSFLASDNVQSFYKSPMNCAFVCLLYNNGDVTEDELSSLKMIDLFRKQQECLLKRECVRRTKSQAEGNELEEKSQASVQSIHRLALHSLLHDEKQSSFSQKDIEQCGIDITSPAMVLLQEEQHIEGKVYTWPHQVIEEFHATSAVKNETVMYMVASRSELNQLSKFLLSYLLETDIEAAKNLLLAMMLMQSSDPVCATSKPQNTHKDVAFGHPCSQITSLRKLVSQQNIDELLQQPLVKYPLNEKYLRVEEIQQCLSHTDWTLRNALTMIQLVDMTLEVSTKEEHYKMLKSVIHPFLPSMFSGSVKQFDRICPWETNLAGQFFEKMLMLGCHAECEIHPVSGRVPLLVMMYYDFGGIVFLASKVTKSATSWVDILVSSPKDIIDTAENTDIFKLFAEGKRGKVDVVDICVEQTNWNWDFTHACNDEDDSSDWKKALVLVNDIFRPKWGVATGPDYPELLTEEDQQELRGMNVKMLLQSAYWLS